MNINNDVSWAGVNNFVRELTSYCKEKHFSGVYGVPRGGLPLAVMISHAMRIPLLLAPCKDCLIVDDIADTGITLQKYAGKYFITTMFYQRECSFKPDFYLYEKEKGWITFPWEISFNGV